VVGEDFLIAAAESRVARSTSVCWIGTVVSRMTCTASVSELLELGDARMQA
jgi:hypothetical protein